MKIKIQTSIINGKEERTTTCKQKKTNMRNVTYFFASYGKQDDGRALQAQKPPK